MSRAVTIVGGLALTLGATALPAAPPLPGGRVTIVLDSTEESDAIAAELVRRTTTPFLVHPDGLRSPLTVETGETIERAWAIELPADLTSRHPELAHALAGSLGSAAGGGVWTDLIACDADTTGRPQRVVLHFGDPTCNPLVRFGAWPAPPSLGPGFRTVSDRAGSLARHPEADLWQPRLDEITVARTAVVGAAGPGEIVVGSVTSPPTGGPDDHPMVSVAYRLTPISGSWPDSLRTWMVDALPRRAFEPLVPPEARAAPDLGAGADTVNLGRLSPSAIEVVYLVGTEGATSDRVRGRVRALLARRGVTLRDEPPPDSNAPVLRLDRIARLGRDPVTDLRLYGARDGGGEQQGWIVLEIVVAVQRGADVVGDIASPDLLWRRRSAEDGSR